MNASDFNRRSTFSEYSFGGKDVGFGEHFTQRSDDSRNIVSLALHNLLDRNTEYPISPRKKQNVVGKALFRNRRGGDVSNSRTRSRLHHEAIPSAGSVGQRRNQQRLWIVREKEQELFALLPLFLGDHHLVIAHQNIMSRFAIVGNGKLVRLPKLPSGANDVSVVARQPAADVQELDNVRWLHFRLFNRAEEILDRLLCSQKERSICIAFGEFGKDLQ